MGLTSIVDPIGEQLDAVTHGRAPQVAALLGSDPLTA